MQSAGSVRPSKFRWQWIIQAEEAPNANPVMLCDYPSDEAVSIYLIEPLVAGDSAPIIIRHRSRTAGGDYQSEHHSRTPPSKVRGNAMLGENEMAHVDMPLR
jgi:hypothetical protein